MLKISLILSLIAITILISYPSKDASAAVTTGSVTLGGGAFKLVTPPIPSESGICPANTVGNNCQQTPDLWAFDEFQNIKLTVPLAVNDTNGDGVAEFGATLPAGTVLSSHYVWIDPDALLLVKGCIQFDSNVLATIFLTSQLASSDVLENPFVNYIGTSLRGFEAFQQDTATFSGNEVCVNLTASTPGDYFRVITESTLGIGNLKLELSPLFIGQGLHIRGILTRDLEAEAVTVHLESTDPSKVLLSTQRKNAPLSSSIDLRIRKNLAATFDFAVHGISQGTADIVATAPGFNSARASVTIVPPELKIGALGLQQPAQGPEDRFLISVGINDQMFFGQIVSKQDNPLLVLVETVDGNVGKLRDPDEKMGIPTFSLIKEIPPGSSFIDMLFVPQNAGDVTIIALIPSDITGVAVNVFPGPGFQKLIDEIIKVELRQNQKDDLSRLVRRSLEYFRDGKNDFAIKQMDRINEKVNLLKRTNKISSADAARLINIANAIRVALADI